MTLQPGAKLGTYHILEQVGRGGMATVYKAYQPSLARNVAVKVLPAFFAEEPGFRERFQQEAIAVAKLRHPNILQVFDYGEENGVTYIVSEFVDGGTLADQIGKPLPVDYVARILGPVASALDYAHARDVLHRDVKPSNILLARDGTPILSDFGLAKMVGTMPRLTATGATVGTPEYMSPEQGMAQGVSPRSDQYALAVVAYEMLTGKVPFSGDTPVAVIVAHMHTPLPPPRSINPDLPEAVEGALLRGLAKDPSFRFPSVSEMVRSIDAAGRGAFTPTPAPPPFAPQAEPSPPLTPPPAPLPRTPAAAAADAAAASAVGAGAVGAGVVGAAATPTAKTPAQVLVVPAPKRSGRRRIIGAAIAIGIVLIGGALLGARDATEEPAGASPATTQPAATQPGPVVTGGTGATGAIAKGRLIYTAPLDAAGSALAGRTITPDASAGAIRTREGAIELSVNRTGANVMTTLKEAHPLTYLAEVDLRVDAPNGVFRIVLYPSTSNQPFHVLAIFPGEGVMRLAYADPGSRGQTENVLQTFTLPGGARRGTLAVKYTGTSYTVAFDGRPLGEVRDDRGRAGPLVFGASGVPATNPTSPGTFTITGIRYYALP